MLGIGYGPTSSPHENCCLETLATVRMCAEIRPKYHRRSSRCRRREKEEERMKEEEGGGARGRE